MKRFVSLIIATVLLLTVACACARPVQAQAAAELLDLGEKYLLELNYAQAAVKFLRVTEIEPKNPRGYLGAAEAYIGLGEPDKAIEILKMGLDALPRDAEIIAMLDALEQVGAEPSPEQAIALATEPMPEPVVASELEQAPEVAPESPSETVQAPELAPVLTPEQTLTSEPVQAPLLEPTAAPAPASESSAMVGQEASDTIETDASYIDFGVSQPPAPTTESATALAPTSTSAPAPTPTPAPVPTPEPAVAPAPEPTSAPAEATTTQPETETQPATVSAVEKRIKLHLPTDREFGETIKLVVDVTRSDTGTMRRVVNKTVKKADFPYDLAFSMPINGESAVRVYYDNELMATQTYYASE
jgi:outer membrane biosynthesis protein TonB